MLSSKRKAEQSLREKSIDFSSNKRPKTSVGRKDGFFKRGFTHQAKEKQTGTYFNSGTVPISKTSLPSESERRDKVKNKCLISANKHTSSVYKSTQQSQHKQPKRRQASNPYQDSHTSPFAVKARAPDSSKESDQAHRKSKSLLRDVNNSETLEAEGIANITLPSCLPSAALTGLEDAAHPR
jgi:hypothetical protein